MKIHNLSIIASVIFCPTLAFAITPATSKEVFCISSHVVVGTVVKATPKDCRIDAKREGRAILWCTPTDMVDLVVQVSEVLGQRINAPDYRKELSTDPRKPLEITSSLLGVSAFLAAEDNGRIAVDLPTDGPSTQQAISKAFEGQQFVFALRIGRSDFGRQGQRNPYNANVWRLTKRPWIIELLKDSDGMSCPKLIPN